MTDAQHTAADLEAVPDLPTLSQRRDEVISEWRERMLSTRTPTYAWLGIAFAYLIMIVAAGLILARQPIPLIAIIVAINIAAWALYSKLRKRDLYIYRLAQLTPVIDRSTLIQQVSVLQSSFANLLSAIGNPVGVERRQQALTLLQTAAQSIMDRGGVTIENASVEGYPPYPEIDRTTLPGNDTDYLQVPLHRIEATLLQIERAMDTDVLLAESIAQLAGEIIPPLRSVEATIIG